MQLIYKLLLGNKYSDQSDVSFIESNTKDIRYLGTEHAGFSK